jgi:cytochrome bd ubiquinol oxidase subunit I
VIFTTLGFAGLYLALGILFVFQVLKEVARGPVSRPQAPPEGSPQPI